MARKRGLGRVTKDAADKKKSRRNQEQTESPEEREARLANERTRSQMRRDTMSDCDRQQTNQLRASQNSLTRARETDQTTEARLDDQSQRQAAARQNETPQQTETRQASDTQRHNTARLNETPQQTETRQASDAQRHTTVRLNETPQQTETRRALDAQRHAVTRAHEDAETRRRRLIGNATRRPRTHNCARATLDPFEPPVQPHYIGQMHVECEHCGSFSFPSEKFKCCHDGKVSLPHHPFPPEIEELYTSDSDLAKNFRKNIRRINTAFAFASHPSKLEAPPPGRGPPVFRLHGQMYHYSGPLYPVGDNPPSFSQLYIFQPSEANNLRLLNPVTGGCLPDVLEIIANVIHLRNPYARAYRNMHEVELGARAAAEASGEPVPNVIMKMVTGPDRRRYNDPLQDEVAAIFTSFDGGASVPNDIVVYSHSDQLSIIPYLSPNSDPLCYPLIYPTGEPGWSTGLRHVDEHATGKRTTVTFLQFYAYKWSIRASFNPLHHAGYLSQMKMIDDWIKVEKSRMEYIKQHQSQLRLETLQGLNDHVQTRNSTSTSNAPHAPSTPIRNQPSSSNALPASSPVHHGSPVHANIVDPPGSPLCPNISAPEPDAGMQVILPSSFIGSPRNMTEAYHDAMTVVRVLGHPDAFITMTCNERWPEILENLKPGQTPSDRPDLIARVFEMKKNELIRDIVEREVLGHCISNIYVIEFQKRGKPHAHILVHFADNDKFQSSSDIDSVVSAEIPDPNLFPDLHAIVTQCMMHGPCGETFGIQEGVCMKDGECTKDFPKNFSNHTVFSDKGYPLYRRRDDGQVFIKNGKPLDNRWVVPYNPYLLLKYQCHINVEICVSIHSIKYLFKYVYKGHDCASITIERDSMKTFIDARYICAPEAAHRLFEFKMRHMTFSVERLPVHLPGMQSVFFQPGEEDAALEKALRTDSKLTAFFKLCESDPFAEKLLYADIPLYYWWSDKKWKRRKKQQKCLSRIYHISPLDTERFHLKLLLENFPGPTSFDSLLYNNGILSSSFKDSCKQRNLIDDDTMWKRTLQEAASAQMPYQLREMFAMMILNCDISDPAEVWEEFRNPFCEDHVFQGHSAPVAEQKALAHIERILRNNSRSLSHFGLPALDPSHLQPDIDLTVHGFELTDMEESLNPEQRAVWADIMKVHGDAIEKQENGIPDLEPKVFFIDGPGGSGKTYLYNFLIRFGIFFSKNVLASAMTGIASTLLPGGQTTHKTFCLPIPCHENSTCRISPSSDYAEKLRSTLFLIIDEASMLDRYQFEAIDRMLRDITSNNVPFGGKILVLGGDFRQTLPVIPRGSDTAIVEKSLISSPLWSIVRRHRLTTNMRANEGEDEFKSFLMQMGDGKLPLKNTAPFSESVEIPSHFITDTSVVQDIFPDDLISSDPSTLLKRAILCPTNKEATSINLSILNKLPEEMRMYSSADSVLDGQMDEEEREHRYPTEYLNSLTPSGMPHHNIFLKEGAIAMLLRNINRASGLTNGVRIIIRRMHDSYLDAEVLTGSSQGKRVFIPRMTLTPSDADLPFRLRRVQFPIKLAYAMTINKSQGQTFEKVGLYLNRACFGHGQLYVAFSRACSGADISVEIVETPEQGKDKGRYYTRNVVLHRVLQS